jgi:transposase
MARRKYTREFKLSAVQLVNQQGYSIAQAAKSLGVDANCIRYWIEQLGKESGAAVSHEGAMAAELRRLRKENARLVMERDILKKAAAFFAREQL